jgi:carbon storage regulator CsrA
MLLLTRKPGESICVDGKAELVILRVKGQYVSVGVRADLSTRILRGELKPHDTEEVDADHV